MGLRLSPAISGPHFKIACGVALLIIGAATPAASAFISNKDAKPYAVIIDERGTKTTHDIVAGGVLEGQCLEGCVVTIRDAKHGMYALPEGNEIVSIIDGVMYYEGAADKAAKPADGEAAKP